MMCNKGCEVPSLFIARHKIYLGNDSVVFQYIFTVFLAFHYMACLTVAVSQFF